MSYWLSAYLAAWLFWTGISLGSLGLLMLHHVVGGRWGFALQRRMEAASAGILLMALLALPLAFGLDELYPWTSSGSHGPGAGNKALYLNVPFFLIRSLGYFTLWVLAYFFLRRSSLEMDRGRLVPIARLQLFCALGLVLWTLTVSFASIDWAMSLEPHWYSTIYGLEMLTGHALAALAFLTLSSAFGARAMPGGSWDLWQDLGNLLLAFLMLWAYMAFSQYLIIWAGNLPEEIAWYLRRLDGAWRLAPAILFVLHFLIPFMLLLQRSIKRRARSLAAIALLILLGRWGYLCWQILPAFEPARAGTAAGNPLCLAMGALWLLSFRYCLRRASPLPDDPRREEIAHAA